MTHGIVKDKLAEIGDGRDIIPIEKSEELECGCRVVCDVLPITLIKCTVEDCIYWKWRRKHYMCGKAKECLVEE